MHLLQSQNQPTLTFSMTTTTWKSEKWQVMQCYCKLYHSYYANIHTHKHTVNPVGAYSDSCVRQLWRHELRVCCYVGLKYCINKLSYITTNCQSVSSDILTSDSVSKGLVVAGVNSNLWSTLSQSYQACFSPKPIGIPVQFLSPSQTR